MSRPSISVIVPAWNAGARITALLQALEGQTAPREAFEVIVVDNGSTDDTAARVAAFPEVRLLHEPQPGSYRARNRGLAVAQGEFCLFTDADCVPDKDWVAAALRLTQEPGMVVHAGRITLFREDCAGRFAALLDALEAFDQQANVELGYCVTANWLCPHALLEQIGGFRADLLSGGDVDCSRRVREAGGTIVYAPEMIVGHPVRSRLGDLVSKRRRVLGGRWARLEGQSLRPLRMLRNVAVVLAHQQAKIIESRMPWRDKLGVMAVSIGLMSVGIGETGRLLLGGAPHRS